MAILSVCDALRKNVRAAEQLEHGKCQRTFTNVLLTLVKGWHLPTFLIFLFIFYFFGWSSQMRKVQPLLPLLVTLGTHCNFSLFVINNCVRLLHLFPRRLLNRKKGGKDSGCDVELSTLCLFLGRRGNPNQWNKVTFTVFMTWRHDHFWTTNNEQWMVLCFIVPWFTPIKFTAVSIWNKTTGSLAC